MEAVKTTDCAAVRASETTDCETVRALDLRHIRKHCPHCGHVHYATICHICKEPRPAWLRLVAALRALKEAA